VQKRKDRLSAKYGHLSAAAAERAEEDQRIVEANRRSKEHWATRWCGPRPVIRMTFGTVARLAVSAGADVKAVQRMPGHAKGSMTLAVYADLFDADLDDVAVNLDAASRAAADAARGDKTQ
jgi:integrase